MLKTRVISGIILAIVMIGVTMVGGKGFFAVMSVLSYKGMFELYRAAKIEKKSVALCGYLSAIVFWCVTNFFGEEYNLLLFLLALNGMFILYVIQYEKYKLYEVVFAYFGFIYLVGMFFFLSKIRMAENGIYFIFLLAIGTWGCDTCAYFSGRMLGKKKLAPVLSPKKTVEGAVGGVIGATCIGMLFAYMCPYEFVTIINKELFCALVCIIISIVSQFGDLTASAIKRFFDIKDYGKLIPGHGGVLDRFDSMMFSAPVMYLLVLVFS